MGNTDRRYTVKAPNENFSGVRAGATFERGTAKATREQAIRLVDRGYICPALEDDDDNNEQPVLQDVKGIGGATEAKLRDGGIETLKDLVEVHEEDVDLLADIANTSEETVRGWQMQASEILYG